MSNEAISTPLLSRRTPNYEEGELSGSEVIIADGFAKFRDGKRWKNRFCVLTKLSPAADCLQLQVYRDEKERARNGHTKASLSLSLSLGIESGFTLDKESHTLAIICQDLSVVLAFDNRERLIQWSVRIANNLGEGQQFLVQLASAPTKSKLTPGPFKLHITDKKFCLTAGIPPKLFAFWEIVNLRRYGVVEGRLVFEGGSRCGKGEGVHVLISSQLHLIMDALDMSSKGQLLRQPSKRFGNVVDSPSRKMSTRYSEMRTILAADSTGNVSNTTAVANNSNSSPAPRESRSAEQLCSACNGNGESSGFWMSSGASSRCDLDQCDNISVICVDEAITNHNDHTTSQQQQNLMTQSRTSMSPAKVQQQPMQIAKPLPSAMERCLSCMSKLGQQGQDLSPSWTMELNSSVSEVLNANSNPNSHNSHNNISANSNNSNNASNVIPRQGSIGSGNSDRLSISSHGSSGGVTEFYDTPRSVLVNEMRRNELRIRTNTPPCQQQNIQQQQQSRLSPQRRVYSGCNCNSNSNGCHCVNNGISGRGNESIYYNSVAEQKQMQASCNSAKTQINLHAPSGVIPGPYENYDFPRCNAIPVQQTSMVSQLNYCGGSGSSTGSGPSIDWNKKLPMDRSSVASSALGSDLSEFYDTPRRQNEGIPSQSSCGHTQNCSCCSHSHTPTQNYQIPQRNSLENYDIPSACIYAATSKHQDTHQGLHSRTSVNGIGKMPLVSSRTSINPLLNPNAIYAQVDKTKKSRQVHHPQLQQPTYSNMNSCDLYENNSQYIHKHIQQQPNYSNLEEISNSEEIARLPPKMTVANVSCHHHQINVQLAPSCNNINGNHNITRVATPPATTIHPIIETIIERVEVQEQPAAMSNYVNLNFSESLQLYENSIEIAAHSTALVATTQKVQVDVHEKVNSSQNQSIKEEPILEIKENDYANSAAIVENKCKSPTLKTENVVNGAEGNSSSISNNEEVANVPLRRSSSVPCKGHVNRGSASSSDSGVSGDCGLFFDTSPLNDIGSLCLHESLPRKSQRTSPGTSTGKNTSVTTTPKPQEEEVVATEISSSPVDNDTLIAGRHYETIDETRKESHNVASNSSSCNKSTNSLKTIPTTKVLEPTVIIQHHGQQQQHSSASTQQQIQRPKNPLTLVSDEISTSSGASDMSDYIESLSSSCSRGSVDTVNNVNVTLNISASPKKSTVMKPRSGREYFKIDRTMFTK